MAVTVDDIGPQSLTPSAGLGVSHTTHLLLLMRDRRHELIQQHRHDNIQQCDCFVEMDGRCQGEVTMRKDGEGSYTSIPLLDLYPFP